MIRSSLLVVTALWITIASCSSDSEDTLNSTNPPAGCDTTTISFSTTITPLLNSYGCTSCHSGSAPSGNFMLTSYNNVKAKIDDGRLWGAINHLAGFKPMPQDGNKMSDCDINKFRAWINRGALNN